MDKINDRGSHQVTMETAKKITFILSEIHDLKIMLEKIEKCSNIRGVITKFSQSDSFTWSKGYDGEIYINFLIDGIKSKIVELEKEIENM